MQKWFAEFEYGCTCVLVEPYTGQCKLFPDMSRTTINKIFSNDLYYCKVHLTDDHKQQHVKVAWNTLIAMQKNATGLVI